MARTLIFRGLEYTAMRGTDSKTEAYRIAKWFRSRNARARVVTNPKKRGMFRYTVFVNFY